MAVNWNDNFIALPVEDDNPGGGAEGIRDTRAGVDERMKQDHFWGEPKETVDGKVGGRHIEGTAVASVKDEDETQRISDGDKVQRYAIGVVQVDMTQLGAGNWRETAGVELDDESPRYDNRKKLIQIYFNDSDDIQQFVDVFNPDDVVSMHWDQLVGGDKEFTRALKAKGDDASLAVTEVPADFDPGDSDYDTNYVIPAKVFWKWIKDAKFHTVFDRTDGDNATLLSSSPGVHGHTYIDQDISANVIEGEIIRGAIWG